MFANIQLVFDFLITIFGSIGNLLLSTCLVFIFIIWLSSWVVKVFKRFIN